MSRHRYTPEQNDFLRDNISGRTVKEMTELFNLYFGLNLSRSQIENAIVKKHLLSGVDTRFKKGETLRPIGFEKIDHGYVVVKVGSPNIFKKKHVIIWEATHGPLKEGEVIIFGDGNKMNLDISNLIKITRKEMGIMNMRRLIRDNADLTRTGVLIADVILKAGEVKRRKA